MTRKFAPPSQYRKYRPDKPRRPRPPLDGLPLDSFRPHHDRICAVFDVVMNREFGIGLTELTREVSSLAGPCCERTVRRALRLLQRLGLIDQDKETREWYYVPTSRWTVCEQFDGGAVEDEEDEGYEPSPEEIERRCASIRAVWPEDRWELTGPSVTVPEVRIA